MFGYIKTEVAVTIKGTKAELRLSKDFVAYIDVSQETKAGSKTLKIKVDSPSSSSSSLSVLLFEPTFVDVYIDEMMEKDVQVSINTGGDNYILSGNSIKISGAQSYVNGVKSAVAIVREDDFSVQNTLKEPEIILYGENDKPISTAYITIHNEELTITKKSGE